MCYSNVIIAIIEIPLNGVTVGVYVNDFRFITYSWFGKWLCVGQLSKLNVLTLPVMPVWNWRHPGYRLKIDYLWLIGLQ